MGGISERDLWVRGAIIGSGAFGTVSLGISKTNGELFAVKSMAASSVSCLENEYNVLSCLDSPYVVRCLGKEQGFQNGVEVCNLMMEYMPGGSIADLLSNIGGKMEESVIRDHTRGILLGLDYLHRQGIVHCDIKGKNVLLGACGAVKLGDFGSARRAEERGFLKDLRGTPLWMAPEVMNRLEQGPPSDIWSLGCTVVEMATGRLPWSEVSNPLAAMFRIACTDEVPDLPACVSTQCRDFLEKCLRRDPKQRWTAAQLLNHPFLHETDCCSEVKRAPLSPTSILDFQRPDWDSCSSSLSQTVPILSLDIPRPSAQVPVIRPSPRDRIAALAAGCQRPNWSTSSFNGDWIVVRSKSPSSNVLESIPVESSSRLQESDREQEKPESTNRSLVAEASTEQGMQECNLVKAAPLIDQVQELCEKSLEHTVVHHCHEGVHHRAQILS
ncbi:hypothetical protein SUGI_0093440, partial [Cryptomeria japonica]